MSGRVHWLWSLCAAILLSGWLPAGLSAQVDAVFANWNQPNRVCLGDGSGGFSCSDVSGDTNSTNGVALGFVDGDTKLDAVFANRNQPNRVCLGDGNGGFACSDVSADTNGTQGVALSFVDGDDHLDAVFANWGWPDPQPNRVCLGDGSGAFACSNVSAETDSTHGVALGFVDDDRNLDAVFGSYPGSVSEVCLGDGIGGFSCSDISGGFESRPALGFLDGDRKLDVVFPWYSWADSSRVCLGDGHGGFSCSDAQGVGGTDVALARIDGDDNLDAVFSRNHADLPGWCFVSNALCLGDGNGGFSCADVSADVNNRSSDVALGKLRSIEIFTDGFESGDMSAWPGSVP